MQLLNEVFSLLHKNAAISVMIYVQINNRAFTSINNLLNYNILTRIYFYSGCSLAILSTTGCVTPVEL